MSDGFAASLGGGHPPCGDAPPRFVLSDNSLHLWLCARADGTDSDTFRRRVLSRYAAVAPGDWRFAVGERGKPRLQGAPLPLAFNVSHSGEWLACAVVRAGEVGVDLEQVGAGRDVLRLARRFFAPAEVTTLESLRGEARLQRFYDLWTLKEAAVKAAGEALPPALAIYTFHLEAAAGGNAVAITAFHGGTPSASRSCLLSPLPGYRVALCWHAHEVVAPALRLWQLHADGAAELPTPVLRAATWATASGAS